MERSKTNIEDYQQENINTREQGEDIKNFYFNFNFGDREKEENSDSFFGKFNCYAQWAYWRTNKLGGGS